MEIKDIQTGKWYMISQYGFSRNIKGKVVAVNDNFITMKFYWGAPFRSRQVTTIGNILCQCNKPGMFGNY